MIVMTIRVVMKGNGRGTTLWQARGVSAEWREGGDFSLGKLRRASTGPVTAGIRQSTATSRAEQYSEGAGEIM
jgi:hypothetical protein